MTDATFLGAWLGSSSKRLVMLLERSCIGSQGRISYLLTPRSSRVCFEVLDNYAGTLHYPASSDVGPSGNILFFHHQLVVLFP